ncbi:MAG: M23 family metallopeptidase [Bacteroidia bacterium]
MAIGLIMPQNLKMPVAGATKSDYNSQSFWFDPWGKSGTHKGVDIFADKGTDVNSATQGIVLFVGEIKLGGKVILILGPKWRLHYYAHLDKLIASSFSLVSRKSKIGTVGDSGNAKGKQPHLHYSIMTAIPYPWRIDMDRQGWKKMFYLNPITYFRE